MYPLSRAAAVLALLSTLAAPAALAHATFETPEATQNSGYKAVIRIGHGCAGKATHTVKVSVPEGIIAAKPMPKPGWKVETTTGAYARTYDYFGKPMAEGVREITWTGGALEDSHYDEFVFQARITDALPAGQTVHVPVTQLCDGGSQAWVEIPGEGQDAHALKSPAPGIRIKAGQVAQAGSGGHGHHGAAPAAGAGTLAIQAPWSRATPPGAKVAGGYLTIENKGSVADRLISVTSEVAGIVEIHEMAMEGGTMKMRALPKGLEIAAGGRAELKPGGFHIMFLDLKRPLKEGETFRGELVFEKAGRVPVAFAVGGMGAREATGGHGAHHRH